MRIQEYITNADYKVWLGSESIILTAGSHVKPMNYYYVPKHIKDDDRYRWFDKNTQVFCYCYMGIIALPRHIIEEVR